MIPTYFMKIDTVPMKATGKMDRGALPAPDARDYQSSYVAPTNETERLLCDAMARVLGLQRVGYTTTSTSWAATPWPPSTW